MISSEPLDQGTTDSLSPEFTDSKEVVGRVSSGTQDIERKLGDIAPLDQPLTVDQWDT